MAIVQTGKRKDGTEFFLLYLPRARLEEASIIPGQDEVIITATGRGRLTITKAA